MKKLKSSIIAALCVAVALLLINVAASAQSLNETWVEKPTKMMKMCLPNKAGGAIILTNKRMPDGDTLYALLTDANGEFDFGIWWIIDKTTLMLQHGTHAAIFDLKEFNAC